MDNFRKGDKRLMRDLNRSFVLNVVRAVGPTTRTAISQITGLELSTITNIVSHLLEEDLVREVGEGKSSGGRRPILLDLNYNYGNTIGIKIEVERVLIGLTRLDGEVVSKVEKGFPRGSKVAEIIELIKRGIDELKPDTGGKLLGIGIGVSGFTDHSEGMVTYSPILNWRNVKLAEPLESYYQIPVFVNNDVNAFTLAEKWYGRGRDYANFICVTVGEGIGAGIVIEGKLYEGATGGAGELGHTCIQRDGPRCRCGERGCLETLASDVFLRREGKGIFADPSPEAILKAARKGDIKAKSIFERMGRNLGIGLRNVVNLLNPEAIILGGERLNALEFFAPALEEEVRKHSFPEEASELQILPAELGEEGWIIGAATLAIRELFRLPIEEPSRWARSSEEAHIAR